jgi:Isocitrate/isopropylmalate dehydrogenase
VLGLGVRYGFAGFGERPGKRTGRNPATAPQADSTTDCDGAGQRSRPVDVEPVHGSAPDIAGKGLANPVGMLWSVVLMLENLQLHEPAGAFMGAIEESLRDPRTRTADLGGTPSTAEVTDFVSAQLSRAGVSR